MTESHADNMYRTVSGFEPTTPLIRSERVTTLLPSFVIRNLSYLNIWDMNNGDRKTVLY